ncbi:MAG: AraC family transcriptional regulator [Clostridia bacterium]|nr:AraC family transcriptional regulator [Clostridia bacterium]
MTLLQTTNQPISTIARSVGFSNSNYFCNVFKKRCNGLSPKAYREKFLHTAQSDGENVATD